MVDRDRTRYIGGSEGAPPVPPPGGYRGARRTAPAPLTAASGPPLSYTEPEGPETRPSPFGIAAVCIAAVFALIVLMTLAGGGTDAVYSASLLVLQLLVAGAIVAALFVPRARMLAGIALAITLVLNTATIGAMGALYTSATNSYNPARSEEQLHALAYPGVRELSAREVLSQPSLEEAQAQGERLMADIRSRLSAEFGYTWVSSGGEDIGPERNGYGGESMLRRYVSTVWTTAQAVRGSAQKRRVMAVIQEVLREHGLSGLYALNELDLGIAPEIMAKLYGSTDPERQHTWEYYGDDYPDPLRFYAMAYDLGNDPTGDFRIRREAEHAQTGEPVEGIQLIVFARRVLSENDRDEFIDRMQDYAGF